MIYAIEAIGTGLIKFGRTNNVGERLRQLQTGCPVDLRLLASCEGDKQAEAWVHYRLCKAKAFVRGEWFRDGDEAREIIAEMEGKGLAPEAVYAGEIHVQRHRRLHAALDLSQRKSRQWGPSKYRLEADHEPNGSSKAS